MTRRIVSPDRDEVLAKMRRLPAYKALPKNHQRLFRYVADNEGAELGFFESQTKTAKNTRMSVRTVYNGYDRLVQLGLITAPTQRRRPSGWKSTNVYRVNTSFVMDERVAEPSELAEPTELPMELPNRTVERASSSLSTTEPYSPATLRASAEAGAQQAPVAGVALEKSATPPTVRHITKDSSFAEFSGAEVCACGAHNDGPFDVCLACIAHHDNNPSLSWDDVAKIRRREEDLERETDAFDLLAQG